MIGIRLLRLALLLLCVSEVEANDYQSELFKMTLEELLNVKISTVSKNTEISENAPGTVIVVTKQQINRRGYKNLLELLEDLPGFSVQRYSGELSYQSIAVRGFKGSDKLVVMQDGVRINSPTNSRIPIADNFPLFQAKQVEVVYGPASALYGADAFSGVINIITSKPDELNDTVVSFVSELGDNAYNANLNMGYELNERISFTFGGQIQQADNPDLSKIYQNEFVLNDLVTFSGDTVIPAEQRLGYSANTESYSVYGRLFLGSDWIIGGQRSFFKHPTTNGTRPESAAYGLGANWSTTLGSLYVKFKKQLSAKQEFSFVVDHSSYDVDNESNFVNIFTDFKRAYKYSEEDKNRFHVQLNTSLTELDNLIIGMSYAKYHSIPKTTDLEKPYNKNLSTNRQDLFYQGTSSQLPVKLFDIDYSNKAIFAQWQRAWSARWHSTIGVRYDGSSTYGSSVNPRLAVVYRLSEDTTFKLLYGSAFLAPSPVSTYEHFGSFFGDPDNNGLYNSGFFHIPNPQLKPETIDTIEFNISSKLTNYLNVNIVTFYSRAENLVFPDAARPQQPNFIDGGEISFTETNANIGSGTSSGLDAMIIYLHNWNHYSTEISASYSYLNSSKLEISGEKNSTKLPYSVTHSFKLSSTFIYKDVYLLSFRARWNSGAFSNKFEPNNDRKLQKIDSFWLADMHAEYTISSAIKISLDVNNLFDARYFNLGGISSVSFLKSPQDQRRIYIGLKYSF